MAKKVDKACDYIYSRRLEEFLTIFDFSTLVSSFRPYRRETPDCEYKHHNAIEGAQAAVSARLPSKPLSLIDTAKVPQCEK